MASQGSHQLLAPPAPPPAPPVLRADAARNRERVLDAARELMAKRGSGVEMVDIAEAAGVGVGTLYRRFPDKEALLVELAREKFLALASVLERELAREELSSRERLDNYIRAAVDLQRRDRSLQQAMSAISGEHERIASETPGLMDSMQRLASEAVAEGSVRADLQWQDIVMCTCALGHVIQNEATLPGSAERLLEIQLAGLDKR